MSGQLGIVFAGGEGPKPRLQGGQKTYKGLLDEISAHSLNAGPLLAAADSGLILAEEAGLKPDWIIGDMDSLDKDRLNSFPAEKIIRHPADKDFTDTELALALLWEQGCNEVWIIGGGGGRLDHLLGIRDLFEREKFPLRWITANEDVHCVDNGYMQCSTSEFESANQQTVSVFPLGTGSWKAESTGLKWPLDNVHWERGMYGLSNIAIEPEITINAKQGRFLIITEGLCQRK